MLFMNSLQILGFTFGKYINYVVSLNFGTTINYLDS